MTLSALADAMMLAYGWRRCVMALLAGACGALALAPIGLWPMLVVPMTAAIWLLDGAVGATFRQRLGAGATIGWWWGFGYFFAGFWWLGAAFLVEAEKFAWAMPLGVLVLPAGLALFPALAFALARSIWPAGGRRILIFALALTLSEWLRGWVLTGFPWNSFGMALAENLWMAQGAAHFGLWGLTLLAVLVGAAPAMLATGQSARQRWQPLALALGCIGLLLAHGAWRLPAQPSPLVPGVKLRILQPNLPQDAKFSTENGETILQRYLKLSDQATSPRTLGLQDVTHLIWPESAFPFLLNRTPQALRLIGQSLPPQVTLITGAARAGEALPGESRSPIFNSIQVIEGGSIASSYDKVHLVPFGEYLPAFLDSAIRAVGLSQFVHVPGGFAAGTRNAALNVRGLPLVAPLICYEAVFPGAVIPPGPRPGLFINVTNDGWFGRTSGPYQHFAQSRLRAIEEGLPLVRAANTGISAVTDGYGRVVASLGLGQEGVVDSGLPRALPVTIYARFGEATFAIMVVMCGMFGFIRRT